MIDEARLFGQSPAFPPRVGPDGHVSWSSGEVNVRESMRIILLTEPGERLHLAAFGAGLKRYLFQPNTVETRRLIEQDIENALARWEPRIKVNEVRVDADPNEARAAIATIAYELIVTRSAQQLSLTLRLEG